MSSLSSSASVSAAALDHQAPASSSNSSSLSITPPPETPRMANLDDRGSSSDNNNNNDDDEPASKTTTTTSTSKRPKSKISRGESAKKTPSSRRRSSSRRRHRSSTTSTTASTTTSKPLTTHNANANVALSASGLVVADQMEEHETDTDDPAKPAAAATLMASSVSPIRHNHDTSHYAAANSNHNKSTRTTTHSASRQHHHHDNNKSWTFYEQELMRLKVSGSADAAFLGADCLDTSLTMLQSTLKQARMAVLQSPPTASCHTNRQGHDPEDDEDEEEEDYDEDFDDDTLPTKQQDDTIAPEDFDDDTLATKQQPDQQQSQQPSDEPATATAAASNNNNNNSTTSSWWRSIVQRLQDSHDAERYQWKDDLHMAKIQGKHLKSELRESIEQRIQWLEERLAWEDQLQQSQQRHGHDDTILSVSSGTTMITASTFGNYTNYTNTAADDHHHDHDNRTNNSMMMRSVAGAATNGVEVSFDTAQAIQRLGELEQKVQDFEFEKEQWERALAHAELELQHDKKLSHAMQEQLQRLAKEVDSYSDVNHKHCKEKQKVQKQLLQLLEQQLATERYEWSQEKELLDHTIQQLTLDKTQASVELRNTADKLQRLAREEKRLRAQRETWLYDKDLMQISIQQLLTDKTAYKANAESLGRQLAAAKQRLGESLDGDTTPPAVESVYSELDESLDRALAERDLFKQEAENLRKTLEMERAQWLDAEAAADDTVSEIRNEFGAMVNDLKTQLSKATLSSVMKPRVSDDANATSSDDEQDCLKQMRDEYTAVIEDLEARLNRQQDSGAQQLQECLAKNKDLITKLRASERQNAEDRGEWKLRLEAALADGRKLRETKEALEVEIRELKDAQSSMATESPVSSEELQAALAETERLQLELARLRQNYEEEVQVIFDQAKERQSPTNKGEWKLQLEAALAETRRVRRLKEDLESEIRELKESFESEKSAWLDAGNVNVDDLRREMAELQLSSDRLCEENQSLQAEIQTLRVSESELRHQKDLYSDLKEKYDRESQEWSSQLDENRLHDEVELEELQGKLSKEIKDLQDEIRREQNTTLELKEQHAIEVKRLVAKLQDPDQKTMDKSKQLSEELRKLKSQYSQAKAKWESELLRNAAEKDARIRELELMMKHAKEQSTTSEKVLSVLTKLINGLRGDVLSMKESVELITTSNNGVGDSDLADIKSSMEQIQNGLSDTIAEITLEADAIMEIKSLVETLAIDGKPVVNSSPHEGLVAEIKEIRTQLSSLLENNSVRSPKDVMYEDAITELQRKISQVAELQAELEQAKVELERRSAQLINAEAEVLTLNDQADAYSDEIMRIQAMNTDLDKNLRLAERKIQALLNAPDMSRGLDDFDDCGHTRSYHDDTTPMLEEALALAQGLQELVQGRDSDQNVLEMLQSLSDLMDTHERNDDGVSHASSNEGSVIHVSDPKNGERYERPYSPQRREQSNHREPTMLAQEREDPPPDPISTPQQTNRRLESNVSLQLVVEQLYGRCQMLERERTEMMEVTLNLLESARKANTAEMDAALATVRRRTMEDIIRARQQTIVDQERLLQRVVAENGNDTRASGTIAAEQAKPLELGRPVMAYAE